MHVSARVLPFLIILFNAHSAFSCGTCTIALMWSWFPPAPWWLGIGIAWFLILAILCHLSHAKMPLSLVRSIVYVPVALIISAFPLVGFVLILFLVSAIITTITILRNPVYAGSVHRNRIQITGLIACTLLAASGIYAVVKASQMDLADKVIAWGETHASLTWERQLLQNEPGSLEEYRKILRLAPLSYRATDAAKRIAEIGDPATDIPLILAAADAILKASEQIEGYKYMLPRYRDAISRMSGVEMQSLDLPNDWRRAINLPQLSVGELP